MPSGENRIVDLELEMLRERGIVVSAHIRSSDELAGSRAGLMRAVGAQLRPASPCASSCGAIVRMSSTCTTTSR